MKKRKSRKGARHSSQESKNVLHFLTWWKKACRLAWNALGFVGLITLVVVLFLVVRGGL